MLVIGSRDRVGNAASSKIRRNDIVFKDESVAGLNTGRDITRATGCTASRASVTFRPLFTAGTGGPLGTGISCFALRTSGARFALRSVGAGWAGWALRANCTCATSARRQNRDRSGK